MLTAPAFCFAKTSGFYSDSTGSKWAESTDQLWTLSSNKCEKVFKAPGWVDLKPPDFYLALPKGKVNFLLYA